MNRLISPIDYLLLFIFSIAIYLLLKKTIFKNLDIIFHKIFAAFFFFKIFAILCYTLLVIYFWKLADSVTVYDEAKNLITLISQNISNISLIFLPADSYSSIIQLDSKLVSHPGATGLESNFFLTRTSTIFYPIALGKYLLINFWFAVFSAIAQFKLYLTMIKVYPQVSQNIGLSLLFIPMVIFYGSPIYKETLCLSFLCFLVSGMYNLLKHRNIFFNIVISLVCSFFIFLVKSYVFYALFLAIVFAYFFHFLSKTGRKNFIGLFFVLVILGVLVFLFISNFAFIELYALQMVDTSNFFQQIYNNDDGSSAFEFGQIETSLRGLLLKIPVGLYTCYFRPHLWEVNKPILILSAIESTICLLLLCYALIKKGRNIGLLFKQNILTLIMFLFVIIMGIIIGLTTFNYGTLMRYKVPSTPFVWIFSFLLLKTEKPQKYLKNNVST